MTDGLLALALLRFNIFLAAWFSKVGGLRESSIIYKDKEGNLVTLSKISFLVPVKEDVLLWISFLQGWALYVAIVVALTLYEQSNSSLMPAVCHTCDELRFRPVD